MSLKNISLSNILLDFLNRESREIFGLYSILSNENHISFLTDMINIAVFICYEFCVENPGSIAECDLVRIAFKRKSKFVEERLIRFPIRESSLDNLWVKKEKEYRLFKGPYQALYSDAGKKFVKKYSQALINRNSKIGKEIISHWASGPSSNPIWDKVKKKVTTKEIDRIRRLPLKLKENGLAIKGQTLVDKIGSNVGIDPLYFRHILQNHFFGIYIDEYNLKLLSQIPYFRSRYGYIENDFCYNYEAIKAALSSINLWDLIKKASAETIVEIRKKNGYFLFRDAFFEISSQSNSINEILKVFSFGADRIEKCLHETKFIEDYNKKLVIPLTGFKLSEHEISAVNERLASISKPSLEFHYNSLETKSENQFKKREKMIKGAEITERSYKERPLIAIFVALQMEREILVERWALKKKYPGIFWTGKAQNNNLILFGPDQIGRVPAAISTMEMFFQLKSRFNKLPDAIISTGIAGGFKDEGVMLGNILIAESVADLASRKIRDDAEGVSQEFRPKQFSVDNRLASYIKSEDFDKDQWERSVIKNAEWPDGLRPALKYGPIASMDEVVSSDEWVKTLCDAWPKLLGIEMETGGVCAAADRFEKKVIVIRGVSDYADPLKSDDEWRKRSMKTIAQLIENVNFDTLLQ